MSTEIDPSNQLAIHLLDVGTKDYGDAILCQFGDDTVLIDGSHPGDDGDGTRAHPSIPSQLSDILGQEGTAEVSLLIVTHAHADHIGCLPGMIDDGRLKAEWALVADPAFRWSSNAPDTAPDAIDSLGAALQEELRLNPTNQDIADLLSDAANLQKNYTGMLSTLEQNGTRVVHYGTDDTGPLLKRFKKIGLNILGPSQAQLKAASALIKGRSDALHTSAEELLGQSARSDAGQAVSAYLSIVNALKGDAAAMDAFSKDKGAINDTSIVVSFTFAGRRILMTGDMQLEKPEVSDDSIHDEIAALRKEMAAAGPWDLVKLSHHGSYNGFSEELWDQLGKPSVLGICTGADSPSHPNPETLTILKQHQSEIQWARTDKNGHTTFTWKGNGEAEIVPTKGKLNDARPNSVDAGLPAAVEPAGAPAEPAVQPNIVRTQKDDVVEVTARIPVRRTRVTITIDVDPLDASVQPKPGSGGQPVAKSAPPQPEPQPPSQVSHPVDSFNLAAGRQLPKLLFVTNRVQLGKNIGRAEAKVVLDAIRQAGQPLIDDIPSGPGENGHATKTVRGQLNKDTSIKGVVLLGGYDVVAPRAIDTLPPRLRNKVGNEGDPDRFVVWSDDPFGDLEDDGIPELPVTRIPDGYSSSVIFAALSAPNAATQSLRSGLRNVERPFADRIFASLPGAAPMLQSRPTLYNEQPPYSLAADRVYLMLHGDSHDGTRFWGEDDGSYPVAMSVSNVPQCSGMVVFTGCCWGALAADPAAARWQTGTPLRPRTPSSSLALQFLLKGARAFVGCTGVHYSPDEDGNGGGGPMHDAFWKAYNSGVTPAEALFVAKATYMQNIPHGVPAGTVAEAAEFKVLREYTCLGLGW